MIKRYFSSEEIIKLFSNSQITQTKEIIEQFPYSQIAQTQLYLDYKKLCEKGCKLPNIRDVGFRIFSQNDEDGILLYIFSQVGFTNRVCIDIGFANVQGSNTANLILNWGFSGILIDGNKEGIAQSQHYFNHHPGTKNHI